MARPRDPWRDRVRGALEWLVALAMLSAGIGGGIFLVGRAVLSEPPAARLTWRCLDGYRFILGPNAWFHQVRDAQGNGVRCGR